VTDEDEYEDDVVEVKENGSGFYKYDNGSSNLQYNH
jgi:hypothetical protein